MLGGLTHLGSDLEWSAGSCARLTVALDDMSMSGR
jgi:hypothetical protein